MQAVTLGGNTDMIGCSGFKKLSFNIPNVGAVDKLRAPGLSQEP